MLFPGVHLCTCHALGSEEGKGSSLHHHGYGTILHPLNLMQKKSFRQSSKQIPREQHSVFAIVYKYVQRRYYQSILKVVSCFYSSKTGSVKILDADGGGECKSNEQLYLYKAKV